MVTSKDLDAFFADGWNAHDVNVLMSFMSDDCVFARHFVVGWSTAAISSRSRTARSR